MAQVIMDPNRVEDMGLLGASYDTEPDDFRQYGVPTFGMYADKMGIQSGMGLAAEVEYEVIDGRVAARTPMLELAPRDYMYMRENRVPYHGMMALGDTGAVYAYDGSLGFFSKIVGAVKSVGKKVASGVSSVLKKIPGGKYLVKLGEKVYSIANKILKPLTYYVGKYATKLAPVAALIPGYGPAIAGALYAAGKIAQTMQKYGVSYSKKKVKKGKPKKLKFKSGAAAKKFQKAMKSQARKQKRAFSKKRKELGLSKSAYKKRIQGEIKAKLSGADPMVDEFLSLGALPPWARRQRRRRRIRAGMPRRRAWTHFYGDDFDFVGDDFDFVDGGLDGRRQRPPFFRGGPRRWRRPYMGPRRLRRRLPAWMR